MTIVAIEGFDLYNGTQANIGLQATWANVNWFYSPSMGTGRFGGQCLVWGNEQCLSGWSMPTAIGPAFTVGAAFKQGNVSGLIASGTPRTAIAITSGGFGNYQVGWRPNPDGSISAYRMSSSTAGTLLGTSSPGVILSNVWHYIEFSGTIDAATGTIIIKVDGTTVLNLAGVNTKQQAAASFDGIVVGSGGGIANTGGGCSVDDMYVTDTAVALGERRVETIRPSADTATKQWTPSSGANNYSRVSDATVNSGTFVSASGVNNTDLYDTVDISGTPASIDFVQITAFAAKSDAGPRSIGLIGDVGGVQLQSTDKALTASIIKYAFGMAAKPGGGAWDSASVNGLKIGPKVTA